MAIFYLGPNFVVLSAYTHAICENEVHFGGGPNERSMATNISTLIFQLFLKCMSNDDDSDIRHASSSSSGSTSHKRSVS
jgi:hypothetical protein